MCCKSCLQPLLSFMQVLLILVGLAITGTASYMIYMQYEHDIFGDDPNMKSVIWIPFGVGILITLLAIVGCCMAKSENRCVLGCQATVQLLFGITTLCCGVAVLVYSSYARDIADEPVNELSSGLADTKHYLSDYELGIFDKCCGPLAGNLDPSPEPCPALDNSIFGYCYFSEAYETGLNASESFCEALNGEKLGWCSTEVLFSKAPTDFPTESPTEAIVTEAPTEDPTASPTVFDENATAAPVSPAPTASPSAFPSASPTSAPIVTSNGDDLKAFQNNLADYCDKYLFPVGLVLIACGGVLLLSSFIGFGLSCRKKSEDYEKVGATKKSSPKNEKATQDDIDEELKLKDDEGAIDVEAANDTLTMA